MADSPPSDHDRRLLTGPAHVPTDRPVEQVVVLLHGLGADGQDLIGLAPSLARALPACAFHAPDAPQACDMAPMGRQWFSLQDRDRAVMTERAEQAVPAIHAFLDSLLQRYNLTGDKMALLGFSQGTMMSLRVGPERPALAGIVGFSGLLLGAQSLGRRMRSRPPVCLIHGTQDDVVAVTESARAQGALEACGLEVEVHYRQGLAHGIDPEGLATALRFLQRVFGV